ncbi:Polyamine transporter-like protein 1 [Elsinoe fawcettii]|nr:Polyamine transporter-like protein 1 [Elsinoe fawcettii]
MPSNINNAKESVDHLEMGGPRTIEALPDSVKTEGGIYVRANEGSDGESLQLAPDGKTLLLPQPTKDPNDPLNWSWTRKHLILFTVAWCACCADWTGASGPVVIFPQAAQWGITPDEANRPNSINVLANGLGGLVWVPLATIWGRAPVLFWTTVIGLAASIGVAVSPTYEVYFAMRVLTGFFLTAGQTMVIAVLKDLFFFHERARKIGLWATLYIASPYLGPCISSFVIFGTGRWPDIYWVCVGVVSLELILVVFVIDETWYNRSKPQSEQPLREPGVAGRLSRLLGVWQLKHHKAYFAPTAETFVKFFTVITRPVVALLCFSYLLVFAWAIGINITATILFAQPAEIGGYAFNNRTIGFLYFTPIVGTFIGEIFGHYFNDWVANRHIRKNQGVFEPEARLWMIYISCFIGIPALVLVGQALELRLNVAAIVFGWGMFAFGVMTMSVAATAYTIDSYPSVPAELGGWLNFSRTLGGFSVGYFQSPWVAAVGAGASFGTQAAIVAFAAVPIVVAHVYGHRLRINFPLA